MSYYRPHIVITEENPFADKSKIDGDILTAVVEGNE